MISPVLPNPPPSLPAPATARRGSAALKISAIAAVIWLLVVGTGTLLMAQYSQTAGAAGTAPAHWPDAPRSSLPQLALFIHPRCPCSRATLGELELLVAHCQGAFQAQVWFMQPEGVTEDWVKTDLWRTAAAIPGVEVHVDHDGEKARLFQAVTSGQALLYDAGGALIFQGGITLARGHSGDNPGRDAIESLLQQKVTHAASTPVFGCALGWKNNQKECTACQQ